MLIRFKLKSIRENIQK